MSIIIAAVSSSSEPDELDMLFVLPLCRGEHTIEKEAIFRRKTSSLKRGVKEAVLRFLKSAELVILSRAWG
jgi:hypothetical protein